MVWESYFHYIIVESELSKKQNSLILQKISSSWTALTNSAFDNDLNSVYFHIDNLISLLINELGIDLNTNFKQVE